MSKDEAIEWIKGLSDGWDDTTNVTACNMAIKALEQEPILDKVRAEIERYKSTIDNSIIDNSMLEEIEGMKEAYTHCLDIIDKYKAESEVEI